MARKRKASTVSKQERSIWDDLVEVGREIFDQLDEILNPDKKQRKPVRVPVPVRSRPVQDPYDDQH